VTLRRILLRLAVSFALSLAGWAVLQEPIGRAVRGVAATVTRLAGERPIFPRDEMLRAAGEDKRRDVHLGILVKRLPGDQRQKDRIYVMGLLRWHVNVIPLPVLAASLGRITAGQRLLICLLGVPLLLALEGCNAALFLYLVARRLRGQELVTASFHASLEHGLAVYAALILPLTVWALVYVAVRGIAASRSGTDRLRLPGARPRANC
jgi:hypothetical protein